MLLYIYVQLAFNLWNFQLWFFLFIFDLKVYNIVFSHVGRPVSLCLIVVLVIFLGVLLLVFFLWRLYFEYLWVGQIFVIDLRHSLIADHGLRAAFEVADISPGVNFVADV